MPQPTSLWFPIRDLRHIVDHAAVSPRVDPDPRFGDQPVLRLFAQGDFFYLSSNAVPGLLVDAFDPASAQRVYALGHSHHSSGLSFPASVDRYGTPVHLGSIPVTSGLGGLFGPLLHQVHSAARTGREWLVITPPAVDAADGRVALEWELHPFPHPVRPAAWRTVRVEIFGAPGRWAGEVVDNATENGWLLPRFTRAVAEELVAAFAGLTASGVLPHPVTVPRLTDAGPDAVPEPVDGDQDIVGPDADGFYRVGAGRWPWASRDLMPDGLLMPYPGCAQEGIDPVEVPAPGQDAFVGMGCLMWLDAVGDMVVRSLDEEDGLDPSEPPGSPEYGNLDPDAEWRFRAVEHALRLAGARRPAVSRLAAGLTPGEVDDLIAAGADVLDERDRGVTEAQRDLVARVGRNAEHSPRG
jgi:hypothetical protein